jgi:hypothetical protein
MTRYLPIPVIAAFAALTLTACATDTTPPAHLSNSTRPSAPTTPGTNTTLASWSATFCSLDGAVAGQLPQPPIAPLGTTTDTDRQPLLDYLKDASTLLTNADKAFGALPPGPTAAAKARPRTARPTPADHTVSQPG